MGNAELNIREVKLNIREAELTLFFNNLTNSDRFALREKRKQTMEKE
ncbi:MAG: hypothetical protein IFNCLDLE_00649 [Ignavibacteriaceae bacterium]|nr:hypothetical protein [Ignavibacteriaceae bacterium]